METAFDLLILFSFVLGMTAVAGALMRAPSSTIAAFTVPASVCFIVALLIQRGAA